MDIQALIDGMGAQGQRDRAETQMTLGEIITILEKLPEDKEIEGIGNLSSYRGYYCDLAFPLIGGKTKVSDALEMCRAAMGQVFTGYKGGDFVMGALTPLWLADYGCSGKKIVAIKDDGIFETEDDE